MKRTILYPHLLACLSFLFLGTGCEREEIVSERIALNALEVQLGIVTRASSDGEDPTLTAPNNRRNWVLEVQVEGSQAEDYVFSAQNEVWIPKSNPVYFPASVNDGGCNVTFTLRPPASSNAATGQDGSKAGLLEADILKNTIRMRPQGSHLVLLAHTNSLIEIAFEQSLENRFIEVALHGNKIHPYSIDNKNYLCIVPGGSNNIILTTKAEETERQYTLDVDSGTKLNTRYVFTVTNLLPTPPYSDMVIHSPIISPWSDTTGDNAILEEANVPPSFAKEFHIEGYTGAISLLISDTLVRLYPYPYLNSKERGEGIYYFPLTVLKNKAIDSLLLEEHSENILIGRNTSDINPIHLKVDSNGKLLFRKAKDGNILINTIDELLLVNTDLESNYKQEADIDLSCISKKNWEPIGNFGAPFKGTYDGNGYAIHSLNMDIMDIKEITSWNPDQLEKPVDFVPPFLFPVEYYWMLPAGAVGLFGVNQGTITNVHIASGTMSLSGIKREHGKSFAVGAICGYNDRGHITSCTNKAEVKLHTILGSSTHTDNVFAVGGISGISRGGSIENSINYGDIITEKGTFNLLLMGGICGGLYSRYETDKIEINSCINHGNMLSNDLSASFGPLSMNIICGGISGFMYYYTTNNSILKETIQHISNCYNTGNITNIGTKFSWGEFGGIVAMMYFPMSAYSGKISSCYNIGEIKINTADPNLDWSPLLRYVYELSERPPFFKLPIENCFYNPKAENFTSYQTAWEGLPSSEVLLTYLHAANKNILEANPAFSSNSWPTSDIWDTSVWGDLGSWNKGNPIYPKLRFEKDFRFYP